MVTRVVSTIGTGGTYSTPALWEAARPVNLVTPADEEWEGQCKNQTFGTVVIAGCTGDATHRTILTTEAGASFTDQVGGVPLRVDTTKGATLRTTASYTVVVNIQEDFVTLSKLMFEIAGAIGGTTPCISANLTTGAVEVDRCIMESNRSNVLNFTGVGTIVRRSVICERGSGVGTIATLKGCNVYNCIFAVPSDKTASTVAVVGAYASATFQNCAFFNCAALSSGTAPTYTTCATNIAGTTGVTGGIAFSTATFLGVTDAARDWRLAAGSALIDAGTSNATYFPTDIFGTAPSGSSTDIGPFEYAAGAAAASLALRRAFPMSVLMH